MSMSTIGAHRPYPGYTPRTEVNIIGSDLPGDPPMPSWEEVYEDVEKLPELIRNGPSQERLVLVQGDVCSVWDPIPEALVYNRQLCSLFTFAYMAHVNDVPEDLLLPVIWTLKMQLRVLKESPEEVLLAIGYYPKGEFESPEIPNHLMRCNTIAKLAQHFMHPKINRPMEAIQCFKELIELFEKRRQLSDLTPHPEPEVWIANPTLYYYYGEALMHEDLLEARNVFEKSLEGLVACGFSHTSGFPYSFRIHANLALILSKLEIDETARKSHESWVLKFVKRNPDLLSNKDLRETFIRPEFGPHPVLAKLGGEKWLVKQSVAHVRMCINCDAREPDVKLSQCGGCMTIWYCSKSCQVAHWKVHKPTCMLTQIERTINKVKFEGDPKAAQLALDWAKWRKGFSSPIPAHALGLHRDPSRGRTHIIIYSAKHIPTSKHTGRKFRIAEVGVFRIDEAVHFMDSIMGYPGAKKMADELLEEVDTMSRSDGSIPALFFMFCHGIGVPPWMGCGAVSLNSLKNIPYDPEWRKLLNKHHPPSEITLLGCPPDREHTF